jgi:alkylation response protein AidB-like acyl-CoA dehydrogenase
MGFHRGVARTPAPTKSLESFLARARGVSKRIEAEAERSERARTLTPACVEALVEADLIRAFLPAELGGAELTAPELVQIVEEVARQDGSAGWCLGMNGLIGGICAAMLPDPGAERVFGERPPGRTFIAGGFPPQGRATREGDGWRVSGHFRFGSGCRHSHWMVCTCLEIDKEAPRMDGTLPAMRSFLVPREQVRIEDNWDVAGLEGTASCDYHLDAHLIEDALSFSTSSFAPLRGKSLYSLPLLSIAHAPHAGFALGVGKRALEEIATHATWRQRLGSASPLAERGTFQRGYARARTQLRGARGLVLEALAGLHALCNAGDGIPITARADSAAATTHAYECAASAASFASRSAGGAALFRSGRLQRCFRDIHAGSLHIVVSDESWERAGQAWLGVGEPQML